MEIEDYAYQIRFSNQFDKSLDIILQYLKEHSYQSFGNFKFDIVSKISAICENPEAFPLLTKVKTHKNFRYSKIMGYQIYFYIQDDWVILVDIVHEKRNPALLKGLDKI